MSNVKAFSIKDGRTDGLTDEYDSYGSITAIAFY